MGKFDTHGGYFAPRDYFRVNEGGSHEENPNGGVQVGIDPQGAPNLLEEGEPVYKDYVYSDNIRADEKFLKENNIPVKFAGKLYSEIADKFVDEAEDRPNDPISNNGLNAMLLRLADAQEAQKAAEQQAQLEEELANMSPGELDALESMLAQQEQEQMVPEEQVQPEMVVPVESMPEQVAPQEAEPVEMPVMKCGGTLLHKYADGGPLEDELSAAMEKRAAAEKEREEEKKAKRDLNRAQWKTLLKYLSIKPEDGYLQKEKDTLEGMKELYIAGKHINGGIGEEDAILRQQKRVDRLAERNEKKHESLDKSISEMNDAQMRLNAMRFPFAQSFVPVEDETEEEDIDMDLNFDDEPTLLKPVTSNGFIIPTGGKVRAVSHALGGGLNRFDDGGWEKFISDLYDYSVSRNRSNAQGKYRIDRGFPLYGYNDIYALEQSDPYKAFTQYVLNNSNDANVQKYLRALDEGTADWTEKLFDGDTLKSNWKSLYDARRNDQKGGIYHFSGNWDNLDELGALARRRAAAVGVPANPNFPYAVTGPKETLLGVPDSTVTRSVDVSGNDVNPGEQVGQLNHRFNPLPTSSRYAKAVGAAALGLYNLAQQPYQYQFPDFHPQQPWGTVNYQPLVYNPMDWAIPYNAISAQTNGALRSLRGTGPSQGANVIALDNNASQNLGNAMGNVWQQNNQHRNEIIAGNNQTEGNRAAFDYGVAKDRAMLYDQAAWMNFQKEFYRQRLNQDEETAKYQAIGNQIDAVNDALAGIGTENFRMNQVNSNTALQGYQLVPNGMGGYKLVSLSKCGGTLLKKPKK